MNNNLNQAATSSHTQQSTSLRAESAHQTSRRFHSNGRAAVCCIREEHRTRSPLLVSSGVPLGGCQPQLGTRLQPAADWSDVSGGLVEQVESYVCQWSPPVEL